MFYLRRFARAPFCLHGDLRSGCRSPRAAEAGAKNVAANIGRLVEELRAELTAGLPAEEESLIILPG